MRLLDGRRRACIFDLGSSSAVTAGASSFRRSMCTNVEMRMCSLALCLVILSGLVIFPLAVLYD
ncbi:hypothetical protein BD311DRAFT_771031 [Dichomitus squalens]|uniref:Uncharacterized protein n=1 Tax=Dichomitus squalens TaxID=114155 RepID=A0A4Q9M857_9APHY|nr:hypothetical protein BD311DRAFT_771031 [Dichomitus squalens]